MSNGFFNKHPMLGSVFDFNHDGSMNLGEAGAMAALGSMAATEFMRANEEAEREWNYDSSTEEEEPEWKSSYSDRGSSGLFDDYDNYDDDFVEYDDTRVFEIDTSDKDEVMEAITSGDFDEADIEYLVYEALCSGIKLTNDDAEEILRHIRAKDLVTWVKSFLDRKA